MKFFPSSDGSHQAIMAKRTRKFLRLLFLATAVAWLAGLVATHLPPTTVPHVGASDKLLHCLGYFCLTCLLWLTLATCRVRTIWRVLLILLAVPLYAALDEITQPLVNRCAAFDDWLADVAGTVAAMALLEVLRGVWRLAAGRKTGAPNAAEPAD